MTPTPAPQPPAEAPHFCPRTADLYEGMDDMGRYATEAPKPVGVVE